MSSAYLHVLPVDAGPHVVELAQDGVLQHVNHHLGGRTWEEAMTCSQSRDGHAVGVLLSQLMPGVRRLRVSHTTQQACNEVPHLRGQDGPLGVCPVHCSGQITYTNMGRTHLRGQDAR